MSHCFAAMFKCLIYAKMLNYDPDREGSGQYLRKRSNSPLKSWFQTGWGHHNPKKAEWLFFVEKISKRAKLNSMN